MIFKVDSIDDGISKNAKAKDKFLTIRVKTYRQNGEETKIL